MISRETRELAGGEHLRGSTAREAVQVRVCAQEEQRAPWRDERSGNAFYGRRRILNFFSAASFACCPGFWGAT
eukprot:4213879-Prymnesium_polylepis.2